MAIVDFDETTLEDLLAIVREWRASKKGRGTAVPDEYKPQVPSPLYVHNASGEEIPAYGCMQVTGVEKIGTKSYYVVDKPADVDGTSGWYLLNSPKPIANGQMGIAAQGILRGYKDTGTVTAGDAWAPTASQWYLSASADGIFVAAGADDIGTDVLRVLQKGGGGGADVAMFKSIEDMPAGKGVSCRARLYGWSQTLRETVDLYNWGDPSTAGGAGFFDNVKAGYFGGAVLDQGRWRINFGPCIDDYLCSSNGSISGAPIAGQQGVPYAFALTVSGLNDDISISGLPTGLSVNATTGNITGTPSVNGVFELIITATADSTGTGGGTCTLTRVESLTISPP